MQVKTKYVNFALEKRPLLKTGEDFLINWLLEDISAGYKQDIFSFAQGSAKH